MTRARRFLWPTLVALVFALTFVTGQSAGPATERHERTLEALRTLTLSDSALQRDVLRARAGLLTSYDPIVEAVADLRGAALALRGAASDATGATRAELERRVADVAAGVDRQESNVETFKSQYAVLRNSLAYFSHLSGMTAGPQVDELASAMLRFTAGEGPDAASEVAAELERRSRSSGPGDPLIAHGRLIVETLPRVDLLVENILDAPIAQRVQAVQETYLSEYARATARADAYRLLLYAAALALVGYLGRLFFRLRATARSLRVRVAMERLIAEISAAFIDVPGDDFGAGIEEGLARLGGHIRADRASFVVGDAHRARLRVVPNGVRLPRAAHRRTFSRSPEAGAELQGPTVGRRSSRRRRCRTAPKSRGSGEAASRHGFASRRSSTKARRPFSPSTRSGSGSGWTTTSRCFGRRRRYSSMPSVASGARPTGRPCRSGSPMPSVWRRWARWRAASRTSSTTSSA